MHDREKTGELPHQLRAGLESLSGQSLEGVQVHRNSSFPASVGALATTQGKNIHLAPGQDHHLAHEGWHVVQQMQGRVPSTTVVGGHPVNDQQHLEREADTMGGQAATAVREPHALQRMTDEEEEHKK